MQVSCHFACVGFSLCCSQVLTLDVNPSVSPPVVGDDSSPCEVEKRCVFRFESALSDCIVRFADYTVRSLTTTSSFQLLAVGLLVECCGRNIAVAGRCALARHLPPAPHWSESVLVKHVKCHGFLG